MSLDTLELKRLRRTWEPTTKAWHDTALSQPWDDVQPPLHSATRFALANVFFFPHATPVQAAALPVLLQHGHSAVLEAPTGSGKTLAFLLPLMERVVRACDAFVQQHHRPPLCRRIGGVVLAPSRALAAQTFVVARALAARFPYNIRFVLCDGVPARVLCARLRGAARGGGCFLVATPAALRDVVDALQQTSHCDEQQQQHEDDDDADDDADDHKDTHEHTDNDKSHTSTAANAMTLTCSGDDQDVYLYGTVAQRFMLVIDEADLVLASAGMRDIIVRFVTAATAAAPHLSSSLQQQQQQKQQQLLSMDVVCVGATVTASQVVSSFAAAACARCASVLHHIALHTHDDFLGQLQTRYLVCDAHAMLPTLLHLINLHPNKKHFVFFNHVASLLFVSRLLSLCSAGARPLVYIAHTYAMHEGMSEHTRMQQYNAFLTHKTHGSGSGSSGSNGGGAASSPSTAARGSGVHVDASRKRARGSAAAGASGDDSGAAERRSKTIFAGGCKRSGTVAMGTGAVLLCTDVAAFGLDVRDVDYVYHVEPPTSVARYTHRVGRVGRMGMRGCSVLLLPCEADGNSNSNNGNSEDTPRCAADIAHAPERKASGRRLHTVANTRQSTQSLQRTTQQSTDMWQSRLGPAQQAYLHELQRTYNAPTPYTLPPTAPIAPVLRSLLARDAALCKLARRAAMAMCQIPQTSSTKESGNSGSNRSAVQSDEQHEQQEQQQQQQRRENDDDVVREDGDDDTHHRDEASASWYTPRLALQALLLD